MSQTTILIVDDSPTDLKLVTKTLQKQGYRIVTAADGDEAMIKAVSEKPSIIVLDVILPKKNGFQVCRQLKTTPDTKSIKVILLTSKNQDSDRFWGLKQGADCYMTKPFSEDDLVSSVGNLL